MSHRSQNSAFLMPAQLSLQLISVLEAMGATKAKVADTQVLSDSQNDLEIAPSHGLAEKPDEDEEDEDDEDDEDDLDDPYPPTQRTPKAKTKEEKPSTGGGNSRSQKAASREEVGSCQPIDELEVHLLT